jgi:hypothetical protein
MLDKDRIKEELSYSNYIPFYVRIKRDYVMDLTLDELGLLSPYRLYVVYNIVLGGNNIFYDIGLDKLFSYDIFEKFLYFLPN